jgi:hypothetical protein
MLSKLYTENGWRCSWFRCSWWLLSLPINHEHEDSPAHNLQIMLNSLNSRQSEHCQLLTEIWTPQPVLSCQTASIKYAYTKSIHGFFSQVPLCRAEWSRILCTGLHITGFLARVSSKIMTHHKFHLSRRVSFKLTHLLCNGKNQCSVSTWMPAIQTFSWCSSVSLGKCSYNASNYAPTVVSDGAQSCKCNCYCNKSYLIFLQALIFKLISHLISVLTLRLFYFTCICYLIFC